MPGRLFTEYFLTDGIKATAEWRESVSAMGEFGSFRDGVRDLYGALMRLDSPNEAVTEQEIIRPVLELLGWTDYLPQQGASGNEDIPDHLLMRGTRISDADSKERAGGRGSASERYRDAWVVEESKRFGLSLDARDADEGNRSGTPHGQILRYLTTAEIESEGRIRWGILTDGGVWRLYDHLSRPRATGYFEIDLGEAIEPGNEDALRTFYLLFRRESQEVGGATSGVGPVHPAGRGGRDLPGVRAGRGEAVRGAGRSGPFERGLHAGLSEARGSSGGRVRSRARNCRR